MKTILGIKKISKTEKTHFYWNSLLITILETLMNHSLIKISLLMLTGLIAQDSWSKNPLIIGECLANLKSKHYLQNNFDSIYPREIIFTCKYDCMGEQGPIEILGTSTITVTSIASGARNIVCQGIKVKETSFGYDFKSVEPFYAYNTKIPEVKLWASANISKDNDFERALMSQLQLTLNAVGESYLKVGSQSTQYQHYIDAGSRLILLAKGLSSDSRDLKDYMSQIEAGQFEGHALDSEHGLVMAILKTSGRWLFD